MRCRLLVLCALLVAAPFKDCAAFQASSADKPQASQSQAPSEKRPTLWVIPHTHWEGAVFKTREAYLEEDLPNILQALHLLRAFPEYRFVLDQAAYVKPFLERYPEEAAEFRSLISQGRLEIVGGNDVMLDVNIPSGESWIRQVLYGKGYYRQALNVDVTTGWALDTFGHHAQMPQLLKLAGYKSYWFQRGVHGSETPSEFLWQGIDGSKIPAFWLAQSYGSFYPAPKNLDAFSDYTWKLWEALGGSSSFAERVAMAGADVISPERKLPEMAKEFNAQEGSALTLRFGVPTDFEQVVARRGDQPVITGELNPVFQGTYSNRIELKQWMREDERILANSEKLAALASLFGTRANEEQLWLAWEPVLFNQAHDLTSGTMVDEVYDDAIRGYHFARELGSSMAQGSLDAISSKIDTRSGETNAIPIMVFNPLGWSRADVAQAEVGFSEDGVKELELRGPDGANEPVQLLEADRYESGGIRHAKVVFVAHDVPAIGWAIYYVVPKSKSTENAVVKGHGTEPSPPHQRGAAPSGSTEYVDSGSIENQFYRATFDFWTGAMTGLELKSASGAWQVLGDRPANVVAREQDGGDSWELYGRLNGARLTAETRSSGLPEHDRHFSNEWVGGSGVKGGSGGTSVGPVFSEFHVEHPFGNDNYSTRARLYAGIRRIDLETTIVNNDKFVRYRLLFPTSIQTGRRFDEIPFGAIERPEQHEFPAQNWIDYNDGKHGVALLNIGLPGSNVSDGTLLLSLMRSARINAYEVSGGDDPGPSDLGLEFGQTRTFHYALVPHMGGWENALVFQAGLEFNNPLLVCPLDQHPGKLSKKWGLLEVSVPNVILSALMPAQDGNGLIVRFYEATGRAAADVKIHFSSRVQGAMEVNLMEDQRKSIAVENNTIRFDLGPFEIKTFRLQLTNRIE
jgi:alpha-mannosidase